MGCVVSNSGIVAYPVERKVIRGLLRYLKRYGWFATRFNNRLVGGTVTAKERALLENIFSVEHASIQFMKPNQDRPGGVYLIPGNRNHVIADYGGPPAFIACVDAYLDTL